MIAQLLIHLPSPLRAGVYRSDETIIAALPPGIAGGSMWSGLSIGARMAHGFVYYSWFVSSPNFTQDVRAAFIINLGAMADVLERQKGGGNWERQMADSLFDFGLEYPQFKGAKRWVQQGFQTLVKNALSSVRPDGVLQEPTINYHLLVMGRYASVIERARQLNLPVPDEMVKPTEKMHEFVMSSALPDSALPLWGDASSGQSDAGVTSERFDFFAGHNDGYRGLKGVWHHRHIWFLKPSNGHAGLWVGLDDIMGEGEYDASLRYRFAPLAVQHDSTTLRVWTSEADGNLLVRVLERPQTRMELSEGIAAASWDRLMKVPVAAFRQQGKLPLVFTSLLLPFKGSTPPSCEAQLLSVTPVIEGARAVWVKMGGEAFLMVANSLTALRDEPTALQLTLPDGRKVTVTAASATLRFAQKDTR